MLDTALIDEEQVPVLNSIRNYLKKEGDIIPRGVINGAEPVYTEAENICYQDVEINHKSNLEAEAHHLISPDNILDNKKIFDNKKILDNKKNENYRCNILGPLFIYSSYDFKNYIDPQAEFRLQLKISKNGIFNGIKLTTFTLITPEIVCGPTPMLNPPLIIPTESLKVKKGDCVTINLNYRMGGGLNTIKSRIEGIS